MGAALPGFGTIDTVVCDIDGVILLGSQAVAGAKDALEALEAAGVQLVFATNNSTRPPAEVREHVRSIVGYDADPACVINSGVATARFIAGKTERAYVVGSEGLRNTLRSAGITVTREWREADAVVTGIDFDLSYETLADAGLAIQNGATFYATNADVSYPRPDGLYPGAGSVTAVVELTTGVSPIVCGKPFLPMREAIADLGGSKPLIIGDRPETDIALGKAEGWPTVLVLTGVIADPREVPQDLTPDVVLSSIADLPVALGLSEAGQR